MTREAWLPSLPVDPDPGWRAKAACRGKPTEWWYPSRGAYGGGNGIRYGSDDTLEALAICEGCPVRSDCLHEALLVGEAGQFGIWGGVSERQRRRIRKLGGRPRICAVCAKPFQAYGAKWTVLCSEECRKERRRRKARGVAS